MWQENLAQYYNPYLSSGQGEGEHELGQGKVITRALRVGQHSTRSSHNMGIKPETGILEQATLNAL